MRVLLKSSNNNFNTIVLTQKNTEHEERKNKKNIKILAHQNGFSLQ